MLALRSRFCFESFGCLAAIFQIGFLDILAVWLSLTVCWYFLFFGHKEINQCSLHPTQKPSHIKTSKPGWHSNNILRLGALWDVFSGKTRSALHEAGQAGSKNPHIGLTKNQPKNRCPKSRCQDCCAVPASSGGCCVHCGNCVLAQFISDCV